MAQKEKPASTEIREDHEAEASAWLAHFTNPTGEANYDSLRLAGFAQLQEMSNTPAMKVTSSAAWVEAGTSQEGLVSGRPSAIAFDPNGPMYLATTNGGLWKSVDNGQHWTGLSNNWETLATGGVAVNPQNPQIVYAGTGIHLSTIGGGADIGGVGVYKSTDGGLNWILEDSTVSNLVTCQMEVNPADPNIIYRATTTGLRLSTDGGATWSNVVSLGAATSIVLDPNNPAIIYAAGGGQIRKSNDSGRTWSNLPGGYPSGPLMVLAMSQASSDTIYLSTGYQGVLALSTDAGQTWTIESNNTDYLGQQSYYANAVAANPSYPNIVVAGGLDIYASTHAGQYLSKMTNWQGDPMSSNYAHADIHVLKYNPYTKVLFALTDGGIFYSASNGTSWKQDMNATLGTMLFVGGDMAVDPNSGKPLYFVAGAQDNGLNKDTAGHPYFASVQGGDGGTMYVSPTDNLTVYGTYIDATLYRSQDGGLTWPYPGPAQNILASSPIQNEGAPFYIEYSVADQDPNVVAVCGYRNLFLSTDGGQNPGGDFPQVTNVGSGTTVLGQASAVHIATAYDAYIYLGTQVGSQGALYYSTDEGQTWTRSQSPVNFSGPITSITTNPNDPTRVYLTVGNTNSKHFYISTDNGQTWTAPATNLPALNYRRIAVDTAGVIYIGHDYGVLRSGDGGKTWYPVAAGLPMTIVTSLHVREPYVCATTYGRGMYYVNLSQLSPLPSSSDVVSSSSSTTTGIAITAVYPSLVNSGTPQTTVNYSLATGSQMTLAVYDILGREERMLVNQFSMAGTHEMSANLSGLPPGQHYIVLTSNGVSVTKPITIQ